MRILAVIVTTASVCLAAHGCTREGDAQGVVNEANQAFARGDYAAALDGYRAAADMLPESPVLAYDQGVAHYRLGYFTQALEALSLSLATEDRKLESKAKFNLGNVAYASAIEDRSNPRRAIELLKTGIALYRDAIELDPQDKDARYNIELAQLLIRDLLDEVEPQREAKQKRQDDQEKQQEGRRNPQQDQQGEGQQQPVPESQEQQEQQAREGMTPGEAERLLQAVRDEERQRMEDLARRRHARRVPVEKDW